jgi:hypothetical protein
LASLEKLALSEWSEDASDELTPQKTSALTERHIKARRILVSGQERPPERA